MKVISAILFGWPATLVVSFVAVSTAFFPDQLGRYEGMLFPVVSDVEVELGPLDGGHTVVSGSFVKNRQCDFEDIERRLGVPGNSAHLDFEFEDGSQLRLVGRQVFGPWRIHATRDQMQGSVFAEVYHRCHFGFLTITRFYP